MRLLAMFCMALTAVVLISSGPSGSSTTEEIELSIINEGNHALKKGTDWILLQQEENGSWSNYPAITALVVSSLLRSPFNYDQHNTPEIARGIDFLKGCVQDDGSICIDNMPGYNTSVCLMALIDANDSSLDPIIKRARDFLIQLQFDETEGYAPDSSYYGGIGYGSSGRPDMSNIQWALEALRNSEHLADRSEYDDNPQDNSAPPDGDLPNRGESGKGLFWDKAITFITRCQNFDESNDQPWAGTDGGFIYYPGISKADSTRSYGSMTYAGLKSFIYADVDRDDPRVQAALNWIRKNYTLEENPAMGLQGLYYYYHTMAKALHAYGDKKITDGSGRVRNWREDLIVKLASVQDQEGFWVNSNGRWWENNKVLVTSYCLLAIEESLGCKSELKSPVLDR